MNRQLWEAMNKQVNAEFESSLVYMQLSYEMEWLSFTGISTWLVYQADEERYHASKFTDHLLARNEHVELGEISVPPTKVNTALEAFEIALEHERKISAMIRDLTHVADSVEDLDSRALLNWFLNEQIEEEDTVSRIIDQLRLVGDDGSGLLRIDAQLAESHPRGGRKKKK